MEIEKWSSEIETGVVWQDFQHAELLSKIGFLHQVVLARKGSGQIKKILNFLGEYVEHHFGEEEKYMDSFDYSEKDIHMREHKFFMNELLSLMDLHEKHTGYKNSSAMSLCVSLNQWVISHIKTHDKELGLFLKKNGVE